MPTSCWLGVVMPSVLQSCHRVPVESLQLCKPLATSLPREPAMGKGGFWQPQPSCPQNSRSQHCADYHHTCCEDFICPKPQGMMC
mmetsp:Transcript_70915/g.178798  ORF Transcript_70915/g.178798 Transcript_70915/m.178798 type:complete len:85 (-) Transcript_70915:1483-1737(-)